MSTLKDKSITLITMSCTEEDLKKFSEAAKTEIGETGINICEAVNRVKDLVTEKYPDLRLPSDADALLEKCLRCRKFELDRAADLVHSYFKLFLDLHKTRNNEALFLSSIFRDVYYESLGVTLLKNRDAKGRTVLFFNFEPLRVPAYNLDHGLGATILLMDELTRLSVETQRLGVVYVCNFSGYQLSHAKQYTLARIRLISAMVNGGFPVRYKGFHVVNSPTLFTVTYSLIKPFLGEKIKSRVHIHGSDLTEFHQHVSPDILPDFLGGGLSYEEAVDRDFTRRLVSRDNYYKELFKHGYMSEEEK